MCGGETFKASECRGVGGRENQPQAAMRAPALPECEHPGGPRPLFTVIPSPCPGLPHRKHSEEGVGLIGGETNAMHLSNRAS